MQDQDPMELESAVSELEKLAKAQDGPRPRPGRPDRQDARALLIALGRRLRSESKPRGPETAPATESYLKRLQAVLPRLGPRWAEACQSELSLACSEHIHGVDPRYLDLPNYDFAYTHRARELLEDRLVAARELGISPPEPLMVGVRHADERLRAHSD